MRFFQQLALLSAAVAAESHEAAATATCPPCPIGSTTAAPADDTTEAPARRLQTTTPEGTLSADCYCTDLPMGNVAFDMGNSGKMRFYIEEEGPSSGITVEFDSLTELADDGTTAVGTSGTGKHSFNSFASQEFTIGEMAETEYQGLRAYKVDFDSTINGGKFAASIYMMLESGTITNDDEEIEVTAGQFKFTISIDDWTWCDGKAPTDTADPAYCAKGQQEQVGAFLDVALKIKGKQAPTGENLGKREVDGATKKPAAVSLGDGQEITLSSKVQVDDEWQDMPGADAETDYFPQVTTQGGATVYKFRFPRAAKIFYDPGVDMGVSEEDFIAAFVADGGEVDGDDTNADGAAMASVLGAAALLLSQ